MSEAKAGIRRSEETKRKARGRSGAAVRWDGSLIWLRPRDELVLARLLDKGG